MDACVFCDIVAGRAPCDPVFSDTDTIMIRPLNPVTPRHVLIIPRVHVADAATDPAVTATTMRDAAWYAGTEGSPFNLITSAGAEASQTVFHLHVHYVPRSGGDGLALPWSSAA